MPMNCHEYTPDRSPIGPTQLKDDINARAAVRTSGICIWLKFHNKPCYPFISRFYCENGFPEPDAKTDKGKLVRVRLGREARMIHGTLVLHPHTNQELQRIRDAPRTSKGWKKISRTRNGGPPLTEEELEGYPEAKSVRRTGTSRASGGSRAERQSYPFNCADCGQPWSLKVNKAGPRYCRPCIEKRRKEGRGPNQTR